MYTSKVILHVEYPLAVHHTAIFPVKIWRHKSSCLDETALKLDFMTCHLAMTAVAQCILNAVTKIKLVNDTKSA